VIFAPFWACFIAACAGPAPESALPSIEGEPLNSGKTVLTLPDPTENTPTEELGSEATDEPDAAPLIVLWDGGGGNTGQETTYDEELDVTIEASPPLESGNIHLPAPSSLGPGFVDMSHPWLTNPVMEIDTGQAAHDVLPERTSGTFADMNEDGMQEIILDGTACCPPLKGPVVYTLSKSTGMMTYSEMLTHMLPPKMIGHLVGWIDLNGDGHKDIITGNAKELIHLADGQGHWQEPFQMLSPTTGEEIRPNGAVNVADIDNNGLLDVLIGYGNCTQENGLVAAALQITPGHFRQVENLFEYNGPHGDPYAVMLTPLGPPGERVISAMGRSCDNTNPHSGFFRHASYDHEGYPVFEQFDPTPMNSNYKEQAIMPYGPLSLVNPMGGTVGDMTLDGIFDLVVTYSTKPTIFWTIRGLDPAPRFGFFQGLLEWPMVDRENLAGVGPPFGIDVNNMIPWGVALLDINRDGLADLITVHGPDTTGITDPSYWVGPQHSTLSFATGLFAFEDATAMSGLDTPGHWRAITAGDLEGDGDVDLIFGGLGEAPRAYRNECDVSGSGFSLRLKGSFSNPVGHGALIHVEGDVPAPGRKHLMGHIGSPNSVSDMLVFPATGAAEVAGTTTIEWPSGHVQKVEGLQAGSVHVVEEPELVVIEPANRRVPADGISTVTLVVTPRVPHGELMP